MANISENTQSPTWAQGIYQIETSDPVLGGANGIANRQARELAARTQWLKAEIAKAVQSIGSNKTTTDNSLALKANAATQISAGAGLTGGGDLSANRTIGLATPSTLSGSTTNWVGNGATGHTHEIARATPTLAGVVKLVNTLNSTALDAALTAAQGKVLAEQITAAISGSLNLRGSLGSRNLNDLFGASNYGVWDNYANTNATTDKNYPITKAGTLFVLPSAYQGIQLYIPFDQSVLYIRHTNTNNNPATFSTWRSIGEVVNALDDESTTTALSAAMGKKLQNEKLGNTGNQTLSGSLNINNSGWEKLRINTIGGIWRIEFNPRGAAEKNLNFNFVEGDQQSYIWFPSLKTGEAQRVAYQSWVNSQIQAAITPTYQKIGNFEITKFPDGTMIQITSIKLVDIVPESSKGVSGELTWAIAFKNKPWVQIQKTWESEDDGKGRDFFAPTSVALMVVDYLSTGAKTVYKMGERWSVNQSNTTIKLLAIGRWK